MRNLPGFLDITEHGDFLLAGNKLCLQSLFIVQELAIGQVVFLNTQRFGIQFCQSSVDQIGIGILPIGLLHLKIRQILLCHLNVAAVGKIVALGLADDRHALMDIKTGGIQAADLTGQQQGIHFAPSQDTLHFLQICHVDTLLLPIAINGSSAICLNFSQILCR